MNELKFLGEAKQQYKTIIEKKDNEKLHGFLKSLIKYLEKIIQAAFDEANESEAGRRWYKNLVEKRAVPALKLKEANIKKLLEDFDFSLPDDENIGRAKILMNETEKIIHSGVGRYISG